MESCIHAVVSLTRPFGPPSPGGRGKVGAAYGRRFMGRGFKPFSLREKGGDEGR